MHANTEQVVRYQISGMDCASCATEIEAAVRTLPGVNEVRVFIASQVMSVQLADAPAGVPEIERAVRDLGYQAVRLEQPAATTKAAVDAEELLLQPSHITPAYRRALWTVVLLNVGYGVIEIVAGFIAASQALKADALDFIGDGMITFLGLLAIGWSLRWRAKSALLQGLFLGGLGIAVIGTTIYRVFVTRQPEAELMGVFGAIALVVNVAAALVLVPHRKGDAGVRAVWLFSRNDAIGNLAVVLAAGLVAWTDTPWPDLAVAVVIASLFLQSSWSIIRDAQGELREATMTVH